MLICLGFATWICVSGCCCVGFCWFVVLILEACLVSVAFAALFGC